MQKIKTLSLYAGTTNGNPASRYVDCSKAHRVKIVCNVVKGNAAATAFTLEEAKDGAGDGLQNLGQTVPLWTNLDSADGGAFTRQANGITYALGTDATSKNMVVVFDVETAKLTKGFRYLRVQTAAGNAANLGTISAELFLRDTEA